VGREIVYCSECEKQIPPGGLHEGRYFLVREEPVCMECYEKLPDNVREGSIQLHVPDAVRKRSTTSLPAQPEASSEGGGESAGSAPEATEAGFKTLAGWAVAVFVLIAVGVFLLLRGCWSA